MQAGKLRHRITIEERNDTQNSAGEPIPAASTVATVSAAVEQLSGREFFDAQQAQSQVTTRFRIRRRKDLSLNAVHRVKWDRRFFQVEHIEHDPTNQRWTHLLCSESGDIAPLAGEPIGLLLALTYA